MFSRKYLLFCTLPKGPGGFGKTSAPGGGRLLPNYAVALPVSFAHILCRCFWARLSTGTIMSLCEPWNGSLNKCLPFLFPTKPNFLHIQIFKHLEGGKSYKRRRCSFVKRGFLSMNSCFVDNHHFLPLWWLKILRTGTATT